MSQTRITLCHLVSDLLGLKVKARSGATLLMYFAESGFGGNWNGFRRDGVVMVGVSMVGVATCWSTNHMVSGSLLIIDWKQSVESC